MTTPSPLARSPRDRLESALLVCALLLPTLGAWLYFVEFAGRGGAIEVYLGFKVLQFSLPLAAHWLCPVTRTQLRDRRAAATVAHGLGSGGVLVALMAVAYFAFLRGGELAAAAAGRIAPKLDDFGAASLESFVVLALLLSFLHSFLEEYYFRGFLFDRLRARLGDPGATAVSSVGFMAHHVIVIATYVGWTYWPVTLLLSAALALTGAYWALLYLRMNSLLSPWLSHVCADLGVMAIGYELLWGGG